MRPRITHLTHNRMTSARPPKNFRALMHGVHAQESRLAFGSGLRRSPMEICRLCVFACVGARDGITLSHGHRFETATGSFYPSIHFAWHFGEVNYEVARTIYMQSSLSADLFKGRIESQNAFNHPVFTLDNTTMNIQNANFGLFNATVNGPRNVQFGARFVF
ncbi:MAG: hypothetical protein M3Y27_03900 [Acidobacteriota bacterium]|nr:hypothetical protein [Acidobacteriota bacterium]